MKRNHDKKSTTKSFTFIFGAIISKRWLYDTAFGLTNCAAWHNNVMDPKQTNQVFELPVAAVAKNDIKPRKEYDSPVLYYPQDG